MTNNNNINYIYTSESNKNEFIKTPYNKKDHLKKVPEDSDTFLVESMSKFSIQNIKKNEIKKLNKKKETTPFPKKYLTKKRPPPSPAVLTLPLSELKGKKDGKENIKNKIAWNEDHTIKKHNHYPSPNYRVSRTIKFNIEDEYDEYKNDDLNKQNEKENRAEQEEMEQKLETEISYNIESSSKGIVKINKSEALNLNEKNNDINFHKIEKSKDFEIIRKNDKRKTLVIYQSKCLDHHNGEHQEKRDRLLTICGQNGILKTKMFNSKIDIITNENVAMLRKASIVDILKVHENTYIKHLIEKCNSLPPQGTNKVSEDNEDCLYDSTGKFDNDSPISSKSFEAASFAAGAVCLAVDKVVTGKNKNAFVCIRPPGHHAGPNGCVPSDGFFSRPDMCSCGFCLLNNVAIGAAYSFSKYGPTYDDLEMKLNNPCIKKVAIIDFDIHHGNGTEEIIRNLIPHEKNYPLPSSWAPLRFHSYKPWRDEDDIDNVFFCSIHLFDGDDFYPGSGKGPSGSSLELAANKNILNIPLTPLGPQYTEERQRLSAKSRKDYIIESSKEFRNKIERSLMQRLSDFKPDLIFLSSGFDGHADDFYHFLTEDDYEWLTIKIKEVAERFSEGRIISVLEGGYNIIPKNEIIKKNSKKQNAKKMDDKLISNINETVESDNIMNETNVSCSSNFYLAAQIHERDIIHDFIKYGSLARSCATHVLSLSET